MTITVTNARGNELLTFTPVTSKVAPVDVAGTVAKSAISPLQSLVGSVANTAQRYNALIAGFPAGAGDPTVAAYNTLFSQISAVLTQMADASVALSCLEVYRQLSIVPAPPPPETRYCSQMPLNSAIFPAAKMYAANELLAAAKATLPLASYLTLHATVSPTPIPFGYVPNNVYLSLDALATNVLADTEKAQAAMLETEIQLADLPAIPLTTSYSITEGRDYSSIVSIVAQEVISKTNTTIATVTINWQKNPWAVSTGILFSALKDQTFSNAPLLKNGQPVVDATMKNLTVVQNSYTRPTVLLPMVMANFRIRQLSDAKWENDCPGHCAFLLSGGVGLNVNQKTAEFAVGPSFQIGEVLVTLAAHFGRYTDLAQDIGVGSLLGSSPPTPLPTSSRWTTKLGLAVSYVLPFQ